MKLRDVEQKARELMKGFCRVCPNCDGRACAGEVPGMGGTGTGAAFQANVQALRNIHLKMRLIHGVSAPDTSCAVLGYTLKSPILAAPVGGVSFNMGGQRTEDAYCAAIVDGCLASGLLPCIGDGAPDFIYDTGLAALRAANGAGIPFIKPWQDKELFAKMERAAEAGCKVVGVDIDAAGLITLTQMGRPVQPRRIGELAAIVAKAHALGLKFVLKGVLCPEDAEAAAACECDAIVVSHHGGRVFDAAPGTAEALPACARAAHGMTVLVDGGIRSGADVLKMLALGAHAVLIGRPFIIGAMGGEKEGVEAVARKFEKDLTSAMILTGCASVADAGPHLLA